MENLFGTFWTYLSLEAVWGFFMKIHIYVECRREIRTSMYDIRSTYFETIIIWNCLDGACLWIEKNVLLTLLQLVLGTVLGDGTLPWACLPVLGGENSSKFLETVQFLLNWRIRPISEFDRSQLWFKVCCYINFCSIQH